MRCLALAEEMAEAGWQIAFAVGPETLGTAPALAAKGFATEILSDEASEADSLARRFEGGADVLVVDHYGRDVSFERACRVWARHILVFDDATGRDHDCDLLLDAAACDPGHYRDHVPAHARILCGPKFATVRGAFLDARGAALARRDGRTVGNILLSFGATDPLNATSRTIDALEDAVGNATVTVVLSSRAPHINDVRRRANGQIRLVTDVADMADLMTQTDLAVGAAGASAFERAVLGLPSIIVTLVENQRGVCGRLTETGAVLDGGVLDAGFADRLRPLVEHLMQDASARSTMSKAASALVDGRGARRVLTALIGGVATRDGAMVRLRLADAADEAWLLELQREPATRRHARNPAVPSAEEHSRWMARILSDPNVWLLIAEIDGDTAGMVRLDRISGTQRYEVSVAMREDYQYRGIASAALKLIRRLMPGAEFDAEILPANTASIGLFRRAGFVADVGNRYRSVPADERASA